jgi:hypothetical protein
MRQHYVAVVHKNGNNGFDPGFPRRCCHCGASRFTAGAAAFFILSQSVVRYDRSNPSAVSRLVVLKWTRGHHFGDPRLPGTAGPYCGDVFVVPVRRALRRSVRAVRRALRRSARGVRRA